MKHTFCSLTVSAGDLNKLVWLERQTGEPWETLRRHYDRFLPTPPAERTAFHDLDASLPKGPETVKLDRSRRVARSNLR